MGAERLEFHITTICNQGCIFCSEYDRMNNHKKYPIDFKSIKIILINKRKKGFSHVTYLGGEPTLYPHFLELLAFTKKLGFKIMLISNALGFQNKIKSDAILDYIDELSLSIHGYDAQSIAFQTGGNSFTHNNLILSINNINSYQGRNEVSFFANIVINVYNYKDILKIIDFIYSTDYKLHQLLISYISPEGNALKKYEELSFDFQELKSLIPSIIEKGKDYSIRTVFFGIPICILGEENFDNSNDTYFSEKNTVERFTTKTGKVTLIDIYSPDSSRERVFVQKCDECKFKANPCTGVFNKYLDYYDF